MLTYSGDQAHPMVNVCGGYLLGSYGRGLT
jgi:hypothetical protein